MFFTGCEKGTDNPTDNPDDKQEEGLSEGQLAVEELISSIDVIKTLPASSKPTVVEESEGSDIQYTDPATNMTYLATPIKTTTKYDITHNPSEFVLLDPWEGIWPGALIQGGTIKDGIPATAPISAKKRQSANIRLTAVTGGGDEDYYKETEMSASAVTQAMNELMSQHIDYAIDTRLQFDVESVQSISEMGYKLGLNVDFAGAKLETAFGSNFDKTKSYVAVKLKQSYFTIAVDNFEGVGGTFTPDISAADLRNYTGDGNPLCYVASVTYGRIFILLYESSESQSKLETELSAMYKSIETNANYQTSEVVSKSSCKLLQIGGDPKKGLEAAVCTTPDALKTFLLDGAVPTKDSPGSLISYKINHLANNQLVRISNTLSYTATEQMFVAKTPQRNVTIDLFNIKADAGISQGKYTVSNHAKLVIEEISISTKDENGNTGINYVVPKTSYPSSISLKNNFTIPLYFTKNLNEVAENKRIVISVKGKIHHETYHNGRYEHDSTLNMTHEFEYDSDNNSWDLVEKKDDSDAYKFKYIYNRVNSANMSSEIRLNYRLKSDGIVYPILNQ